MDVLVRGEKGKPETGDKTEPARGSLFAPHSRSVVQQPQQRAASFFSTHLGELRACSHPSGGQLIPR